MVDQNSQEPGATIEALRLGIRKITHELSSPLGVLRMTAHYLQTQEMTQDKQQYYLKVLNESVDRLEDGLHRMRALADPDYRPQTQSVPPNEPSQ